MTTTDLRQYFARDFDNWPSDASALWLDQVERSLVASPICIKQAFLFDFRPNLEISTERSGDREKAVARRTGKQGFRSEPELRAGEEEQYNRKNRQMEQRDEEDLARNGQGGH
jgi:hypothetical protein